MKKLNLVGSLFLSTILIGCGGGGSSAPQNKAPEAKAQSITLNENQNKQVVLDATDADGNSLTYKIVKAPAHGTFKDGIYTPRAGYVGSDSFTFIANDGTVDSAPATVTITITADFDGDNISDALDTDDDNDGVVDTVDAFPLDATESVDTDGDGVGNNADIDDDGDGISDVDEIKNGTNPLVPEKVTLSGKVTYERVHTNSNNIGLDYNNITKESARNVRVDIIDASNNVLKSTVTDDNGNYSVLVLSNTDVKVRVYAKMIKAGTPAWDVKVVDNTNGNALYVMEGSLSSTGESNSIRNLNASASTKVSPPFAIIDSVYSAMKKVLDANGSTVFPELNMNWTVNNIESGTYFDGDKNIMIQGDQQGDSDEYDDHIIIHEWGHYFESKFSRADSMGGQHGMGEALDIRLALGEGWGNALSAIVTDDPVYFDTFQDNGWNMNIETQTANNPGWFSEASVQRILYDLYDSNDDGSDNLSLGFTPIYNVLVGKEKVTPAFTSIFTFIKALKDENSDEIENIDSIVSSESIASITDIWGSGRTNREGSYPYTDLSIGTALNIEISNSDGVSNKLSNHKYVKFRADTTGEYTIKVEQTNGGDNSDPDFYLYKSSPFGMLSKAESYDKGIEEIKIKLDEGNYLLDVTDAMNLSKVEFTVTINQ